MFNPLNIFNPFHPLNILGTGMLIGSAAIAAVVLLEEGERKLAEREASLRRVIESNKTCVKYIKELENEAAGRKSTSV